mmetsp:Transcript_49869/g.108407  ORF Transcript_49869/g.108407 Transcript_49869/m.108407 type:complete len:420 (-) Transcript_49869:62-1321(-)
MSQRGRGVWAGSRGRGRGSSSGIGRGRGPSGGGGGGGGGRGGRGGKGGQYPNRSLVTRIVKSEHVLKRVGQVFGRGKGKGKGKGDMRPSDGICHEFSKNGVCPRGNSCRFTHARRVSSAVETVQEDSLARHFEAVKAHSSSITAIMMTTEGIYTASTDKSLKRWKPVKKADGRFELQSDLMVPLDDSCYCLLYNSGWIFCGLWDGSIRAFSEEGQNQTLKGHSKKVTALIVHESVLISGSHDQDVRLWQADPQTKAFNHTHTVKDASGTINKLRVLGGNLFIGGSSGVALCSLADLRVTKVIPPLRFVADFLEFQGFLIVSYADGSIRVFDAEGNTKSEMAPFAGPIVSMAGLESGPRVICGHSRGQVSSITLPDFQFKLQFQAFDGGRVESMMCAGHDGIFLLGHVNGSLQLWQRLAS